MKKLIIMLMLTVFSFGTVSNYVYAIPPQQHLKKDGTPDKRFNENKHLKKDGTPDMRYNTSKKATVKKETKSKKKS